MAEFQEVAKHWKRMCNKYWRSTTCHGCPIAEHEGAYEACYNDVAKMEEVVLEWAAEHPEPVYPTWVDWLVDHGLIFVTSNTYAFNFLKATDPIPADIAEKLGIEPKEG